MNILENQQTKKDAENKDLEGKILKRVAFCLEQNIVYPIFKCQNEYQTKKQKRRLARKVSIALRGREINDLTSSEDEINNYQDSDDSECYQEGSLCKQRQLSTPREEDNVEQKLTNRIKGIIKKQPCLIYPSSKRELDSNADQFRNDQIITSESVDGVTEKKEENVNQKNEKVTDFADELNINNEVEQLYQPQISIILDELEEFANDSFSGKSAKFDISDLDQIKKKIDNINKYDIQVELSAK